MWTNRPYILIYNEEIFNLFPITPLLEPYNQGRWGLLIIIDDIDDGTFGHFVVNQM